METSKRKLFKIRFKSLALLQALAFVGAGIACESIRDFIADDFTFHDFIFSRCLLIESAEAEEIAAGEARQLLDDTVNKVRETVLRNKDLMTTDEAKKKVDAELHDILAPAFDFNEMAKMSAGANWHKATPDQQQEFVQRFSDLLARNYLKQIRDNILESKIKVVSEAKHGNSIYLKTEVAGPKDTVHIDYRLKNNEGKLRVYDVVVENIGLVSNYRSEFSGIIRQEGFAGLLQRLKEKNEKRAT